MSEPIPLSQRTRPAVERDPNWTPPTPTTEAKPKSGKTIAAGLAIAGLLVFIISLVSLLNVQNFYLAMIFTAFMTIGGTAIIASLTISAVRRN